MIKYKKSQRHPQFKSRGSNKVDFILSTHTTYCIWTAMLSWSMATLRVANARKQKQATSSLFRVLVEKSS
jgi:hypothetical protein